MLEKNVKYMQIISGYLLILRFLATTENLYFILFTFCSISKLNLLNKSTTKLYSLITHVDSKDRRFLSKLIHNHQNQLRSNLVAGAQSQTLCQQIIHRHWHCCQNYPGALFGLKATINTSSHRELKVWRIELWRQISVPFHCLQSRN